MSAGAVNTTAICPLPGVTVLTVGAPGTVRGVTETVSEAVPEPAAFTARRATSYAVPLVNPVIVTGEASTAGLNATHVGVGADAFNEYS